MLIDTQLAFDGPTFGAITTTRDSLNTLDMGVARDVSIGNPLTLLILSNRLFAGGTSVQIAVQGSDVEGSGYVTMAQSVAITLAQMNNARGLVFPIDLPRTVHGAQAIPRYLKLVYTVVGTFTAGAVQAYLIQHRDDMIYYPSGFSTANI